MNVLFKKKLHHQMCSHSNCRNSKQVNRKGINGINGAYKATNYSKKTSV